MLHPLRGVASFTVAMLGASSWALAQSPAKPLPDAPGVQPAQNSTAQQLGESDADYKAREHTQAAHDLKAEESQRILKVIPGANVVLSGHAVPLSPGQKTGLALHAAADPFNIVGAFVIAGLGELSTNHKGYSWGAPGYFKRAGANLADVLDGTMLSGAALPTLLHQDPRYFRQGAGPNGSRLRHALLAAVVCRGDHGRTEPNYSNLLGNLAAGAISNTYYPRRERGAALTFVNGFSVIGEGSAGNLALEFGPDLSAWLVRRKGRTPSLAQAGLSSPASGTSSQVSPAGAPKRLREVTSNPR